MAKADTYPMEQFFQALGDRTRLRVLNLLCGQELCVCYLVEILGESQPKISRHLAYLRRAGMVAARRDGTWMHYRIVAPPHAGAAAILERTLGCLRAEKRMRADRSRLSRACCAAERTGSLEGAPLPSPVGFGAHQLTP